MVVPPRESDSPRLDALTRPPVPVHHGDPLLASYSQRVAGFLVDIGIPAGLLAVVIIAALITRDWFVILVVHGVATVISVVFLVWNCGWCQGRHGQSIGKRMLGMRLVGAATGQPVGFGRAVGRQFAHLLDVLPMWLGYLWPLWDEQRQTFADKVCATLVVRADV